MTAARPIDQDAILRDLTPHWVTDLSPNAHDESSSLLRELVQDWAREANSDADPAAVHAIQRTELDDAGHAAPAARLAILRTMVLDRHIRRLRVRTYALGAQIIDKSIDREVARTEGRAMLAEAESLSARIRAAGDVEMSRRLEGLMSDAVMEALYAVEGTAMSPRLARHAQQK